MLPESGEAPFPAYLELLAEVEGRLGWGLGEFVGQRVLIDFPIPLARYSIELEVTS